MSCLFQYKCYWPSDKVSEKIKSQEDPDDEGGDYFPCRRIGKQGIVHYNNSQTRVVIINLTHRLV